MPEAVHADLETARGELPQQASVQGIPGAEVEGGAEAVLLFEVGHGERPPNTALVLDVVREDHGRAVPVGPEPAETPLTPVLHEQQAEGVEAEERRDAQIQRPRWEVRPSLPADDHPPAGDLGGTRDEPLRAIEEVELLGREAPVGTVARPFLAHIAAIR